MWRSRHVGWKQQIRSDQRSTTTVRRSQRKELHVNDEKAQSRPIRTELHRSNKNRWRRGRSWRKRWVSLSLSSGSHVSAGSTTPIHLQLIDVNNDKSREIRLKKKDMEGHHFAPNSTDEFKITVSESLSTLKAVKPLSRCRSISRMVRRMDLYHRRRQWSTSDTLLAFLERSAGFVRTRRPTVFPIQRWLDKGEDDHKTHVTLDRTSLTPCEKFTRLDAHSSDAIRRKSKKSFFFPTSSRRWISSTNSNSR